MMVARLSGFGTCRPHWEGTREADAGVAVLTGMELGRMSRARHGLYLSSLNISEYGPGGV